MLFTDPGNGRVDVFGGFDGNLFQLTTFQWTGSDWRQLHPSSFPSARSAAAAATNIVTKQTVLFDGIGDVNPYNTWTWDGKNWSLASPSVEPQSLYSAGSTYDPHLGAILVFGGGHAGVDQNQTWAWTGTQWLQLLPVQSPSTRESMGMTYDPSTGSTVVFGGYDNGSYLNDTWQLARQ